MKKTITLIAITLTLNSCNTFIGVGKDFWEGGVWTKNKIQGSMSNRGGGSSNDPYGSPIY